jgi:acetylornithine deacetylase/succinyl-diaminopimelate desuccinylase family protein
MINKQRLVKLTQDLIRINSQNPGSNERAIAGFVKKYLTRLGLRARLYEFKKGRSNVVCVIKGRNKKHSLLLTPHLDTVPQGRHWHFPPLGAKIRGGKIYGLGATDCKGNLAVFLETLNSLIEEKASLGYNLVFAATADEECGSFLGLIPLLEKRILRPDAAVVLDSDDFKIIVTQKGLLHLKVKITGLRAHGAYPWRGRNAIAAAVDILQELKSLKWPGARNDYLRPPTLNIGTIQGGDKVNIVADWCEFELDFRFLPGTREKVFLQKLKKIIRKYARCFKIEIQGLQLPYAIKESHYLVRELTQAMRCCGKKARLEGSEGATVMTFFQKYRIPALATGFGSGRTAHSADEYVRIDNLYKGSLVLEKFLKDFHFSREE